MNPITLNLAIFRTMFPQFADPTLFPDLLIQGQFNLATGFISPWPNCGGMSVEVQTTALYLMTAQLLYLGNIIAAGGSYTGAAGVVTQAKIGDVSTQLAPPPYGSSEWRYWLNLSPYGQQLLALLEIQGVGGMYIGGLPERSAFRRVGGGFGGPGWF